MSRFQADDAIATAAHRYGGDPSLQQTVICSNDNDFAQCIRGDRIVRLNRITKETWNEADVVSKFGVPPSLIPEYFALVGDPSDGIPGIPGFGPKSAAALIGRYGRLENVPSDPEAWEVDVRGKAKLAETLNERKNEALLYRNLSTLRTDVPLPEQLEDIKWRGAHRDRVASVARLMNSPELLERTIRYTAGPDDRLRRE